MINFVNSKSGEGRYSKGWVLLARAGWFAATYDGVLALFFVVFAEDVFVTAFFARLLSKRISIQEKLVEVKTPPPAGSI